MSVIKGVSIIDSFNRIDQGTIDYFGGLFDEITDEDADKIWKTLLTGQHAHSVDYTAFIILMKYMKLLLKYKRTNSKENHSVLNEAYDFQKIVLLNFGIFWTKNIKTKRQLIRFLDENVFLQCNVINEHCEEIVSRIIDYISNPKKLEVIIPELLLPPPLRKRKLSRSSSSKTKTKTKYSILGNRRTSRSSSRSSSRNSSNNSSKSSSRKSSKKRPKTRKNS